MNESGWLFAIGCTISGILATFIFTQYRSRGDIDITKEIATLHKKKRELALLEEKGAAYRKKYPTLRYAVTGLLILNLVNFGVALLSDYRTPPWLVVPLVIATVIVAAYNLKVQKSIYWK